MANTNSESVPSSTDPDRHQYSANRRAFVALLPELSKSLHGQFVAVHDGRAIDSDQSELILCYRVRANWSEIQAFIGFVWEDPPKSNRMDSLRKALNQLSLPASSQIALFTTKDTAATQLIRQYEVAHNMNNISRNELLPVLARQMLDELFELVMAVFNTCWASEPYWTTDECLGESDHWAEIRVRAQEAVAMINQTADTVIFGNCPEW